MVDYLDEFKLFLDSNEKNIDENRDKHSNNEENQENDENDEYQIIERESIFTINSKDRNLINETAYNFSINFGTNNPNKINIGKNFRNIVSVEFLGLIIPDLYVDVKELLTLYNKNLVNSSAKALRLKRICDLPYLLLNISELKNTNSFGSNPAINKATYVLVLDEIRNMSDNNSGTYSKSGTSFTENVNLDKTVLADTNKRNLYYKDFSGSKIEYTTPQNYLGNIEIKLTTPEGILLSNLNDFLEVYRVYKIGDGSSDYPYRLRIKFYKYFCADEFRIGDRIVFKDIGYPIDESLEHDEDRVRNDPSLQYADEETLQGFIQADIYKRENNGFTNPNYLDRYSLILQFLEREEGHTIIEVGGSPASSSKLFSEIGISFESQIPMETADNVAGGSVLNTLEMSDTASAVLHRSSIDNEDGTARLILKNVVGTIYSDALVDCIGVNRTETRIFAGLDLSKGTVVDASSFSDPDSPSQGNPHTLTTNNDGLVTVIIKPAPLTVLPAETEVSFHYDLKDIRLGPILFDTFYGYPPTNLLFDPTQNIVFAEGKCINVSNQISLGLKVKYQQRELKALEGKLL